MPLSVQPFCGGSCPKPRGLWIYSLVILLLYGFFKEFKPSEAFLTPFLLNETDGKNITKHDVNYNIYPYWTYSYLVAAFFVLIFTDIMRYNPVILIESAAYLSTRMLLIWGSSVASQQLMQLAYGIATATEVGYYSYIYTAVPLKYFEKITGPVRAVVLFGRSLSSFTGQLLFSFNITDYYGLNYISFGSVCFASLFAILLPWYFQWPCVKGPDGNVNYVHLQEDADEGRYNDDSDKDGQSCSCYNCFWWIYDTWKNQLCDFIRFYTNLSLLRWSLWWAFAMCGMLQVGNYVQSLWKVINIDNHDYDAVDRRYEMNGLVEGMTDLGAAAMALLASLLRVDWSLWGELTMGSLSLLAAIVLMVSSYTGYVWLAYMCHVMFRSTYAFIITIASSQIAVHVDYESYGLIFGFNTFIALVLQTILTLILETWLNVSIRLQFIIYGGYYYILTLIFIFAGVYKLSVIGWITSLKSCCGRPRRFSIHQSMAAQYVDTTSSESDNNDNINGDDDDDKDGHHHVTNDDITTTSLPSLV